MIPACWSTPQVAGEQAGRHRQYRGQLGGRRAARQQRAGDMEPGRVGKCGVHCGPTGQPGHLISVY